jgi:hypothetical protein
VQGEPTAAPTPPVEPPLEPPLAPPLDPPPPVLVAGGTQTLFTQEPWQQSLLVVQEVPAPALGLSGMQERQSLEMLQPMGQVAVQPPSPVAVVGEQPLPTAMANAARASDLRHRSI